MREGKENVRGGACPVNKYVATRLPIGLSTVETQLAHFRRSSLKLHCRLLMVAYN